MGRLALLLLLLALALSPALFAQSLVSVAPQQCVWRGGDDLGWADPGLDESGWSAMGNWNLPVSQPYNWVRCHLDPASLHPFADPHLALQAGAAYQLFFQGKLIGSNGNLATGDRSVNNLRSYALGASSQQGSVIALRLTFRNTEPLLGHFVIGNADALAADRAHLILGGVTPILPYVIAYSIAGIIGLLQLGLFYYERSRRELLWLSLASIGLAVRRLNTLCHNALLAYPGRLWEAFALAGNFAFPCEILFFFSLARRRVPWWIWVLTGLALSHELLMIPSLFFPADIAFWFDWATSKLEIVNFSAWSVASLSAFVAFWPWAKLSARLRPLAVCCYLWSVSDSVYFALQATASLTHGGSSLLRSYINALYEVRAIITVSALLVLLWLLFRDQRKIFEERALLAGEMQAARDIQRMLAPAQVTTAPGVVIHVAFQPMREVGGDFYLCRVLGNGTQRLLVGDVSGKGTAAAMTAALLLGGAEDHDVDSPGSLLGHLNRVMCESRVGGFATSLCADLAPDGTIILANAGHLPPYLRGAEIAISGSLPLGLDSSHNSHYEEASFRLSPGDILTFVSDGVVEARSTSGELFGFERTCAISNQSAETIARAAQAFGQEDDITVLTIAFGSAGVLHA